MFPRPWTHPATAVACGLALGLAATACGDDPDLELSTRLSPAFAPAHYVDQANRYFDALDEDADPDSLPTYSERVVRWEWPPWLLLTGYGAEQMQVLDDTVKSLTPATVEQRDCRFFDRQPFARCRVSFQYEDGPCPIYEEFTFNDQGEITFIEAWSDLPGYLPTADPTDAWAEGRDVDRLSTRVPGLGSERGLIEPESPRMRRAADDDADLANLLVRIDRFWPTWFEEYGRAGDDLFARGCGWQ